MPTDEGLLTLIENGHVPWMERGKYGYVGHDSVPFERLVCVIVNALLHDGRFPRRREVFDRTDGLWIAKEEVGFAVWMSRSGAVSPDVVVEKSKEWFEHPEDAVRFYLKWSCQLPGMLDGVSFV